MSIIKVKTGGITADAITDALIADDVVGTEHLTANEVDTTALGADAVTGAQLADDAVNSEHYTDGSVDTAHIADANVTTAKIAADAITAAKIADDAISEEHLDVTAITGHTAETSVADGDLVVIHDASATALRKMTVANLTANAGGGKVLQVLQTVKTDTFSTSTALGSFTDVTGMSQAITPSATSSKILVTVCGHFTNQTSNYQASFKLVRDSTAIFIGDSRGSTTRSSSGGTQSNGNMENFSITFLDSPNTTSSTTYKLQGASESGGTLFLGGTYISSSNYYQSSPASITVMEIGA